MMNEQVKEFDLQEFLKPSCPVKIGDRFFKNYKADFNLLFWYVTDIQDAEDENGPFYAITAKCDNIAVGKNIQVFSSRYLTGGGYTIQKRGVDF